MLHLQQRIYIKSDILKKHKEKYENAKAEYEKAYGPITVDSSDSDTVWEWSTTPWPWERMV